MDWQPIATAPMDGSSIILGSWSENGDWCMDFVEANEFEFDGGDWGVSRNICPYTHWHPIAKPPVEALF